MKKLDNFYLTNYQNNEFTFIQLIRLAICPFFKLCHKPTDYDTMIIDFTREHYYKYTDFFKFLDKFIELNIIKKLLLKKEELEIVDVLKKVIVIKNDVLLENMRKPRDKFPTERNPNLHDKLKKKLTLEKNEEKLKKYLEFILKKDNKSIVETNMVDRFEDLFK